MDYVANTWIWLGFSIFLIIALSIDTFALTHNPHESHKTFKHALFWTLIWISSALIFNVLLWFYLYEVSTPAIAHKKALDFFTGYLIEKSLSIDNLFAFYVIFHQFRIPAPYQPRIFAYGIWSAIIMRLILILIGSWLIATMHWVIYAMGAFLLLTGLKMFFINDDEKDLKQSSIFLFLKNHLRITEDTSQNHFFIRKNKFWYATPLFIALIFIEISDLIFAFDSIPAIFAITTDPFIVWTSNIFAILGLRAMYFLLANLITRFYLLKYGIALIIIFVGCKMLIEPWLVIPVGVSLCVVASILIIFGILSLKFRHSNLIKKG